MALRKNKVTLKQIQIACKNVEQLLKAGMTENLAIRQLELFADLYGRAVTFDSIADVKSHIPRSAWSRKARRTEGKVIIEHGTPQRQLAQILLETNAAGKLTQRKLDAIIRKYWKLAVITVEVDAVIRANGHRSSLFKTPEERWAECGIRF